MNEVLYTSEDFEFTCEYYGEMVFLHLAVDNWTKEIFTKMRGVFHEILSHFQRNGFDTVFGTTEVEKSVKLWNMLKPCDEIKELKYGSLRAGWLGAWHLGEN